MKNHEFGPALAGLVNSAIQQGLDVYHIVGSLELCKLELVRNLQDAAKEQQSRIVKVNRLPPPSLS